MTSKRLVAVAAATLAGLPALAWGWQRETPSYLAALATDGDGNAVVTGGTTTDGGASDHFSVRKFAGADGSQLWFHEFQGTVATGGIGNGGLAVATTSTGDVVAGGTVHDTDVGGDLAVVQLAGATGAELWRTVIDGAADDGFVLSLDFATAVAVDAANDVLVAGGLAETTGTTTSQFVVLKLGGATGAEAWRTFLGDGYANAVAVDANGDVVAAGVLGGGGGADLVVAKFSGADGTELWRVVVDGSQHSADEAKALALDAAGDVVVGGVVSNTGTNNDLFVAKLAGADGSELWRREIDGPGVTATANFDAANAVAVDAAGDVVVGGDIGNVTSNMDFAVLKLSGADGSDVWQYELDGADTAIDQDTAQAVAVTGAGDVLAVGTLRGASATNLFTIVKLDGASGAERWVQEIPGAPGNGAGRLLAVDGADNVLAAGDLPDGSVVLKRAEALAGRKIVVADTGPYGSRLLKLASSDKGIMAPDAGGNADPTTFGAVLELRNPITDETASIPLPASSRWVATVGGYRYTDTSGAGPCSLVDLRAGRVLKVRCKGSNIDIGFSLDEPSQGALEVTLVLGDLGPRYCARFGGTIVKDAGNAMTGGTFVAKNAPASACSPP